MANEEIKKAYRTLGREANFYDGMITCSTVPGKAVCKLARTDWFIPRFYEPKSFFTPPFETKSSLRKRLERFYADVTLDTVKSMVCFACRKGD